MNKTLACFAAVVCLASCGTTSEQRMSQSLEPSRISYSRIFCTPDNESHFDTVTIELAKVDAAPPALPVYAKGSSATRVAFASFEAGWGAQDEAAKKYHPAPASQYVVYLAGQMSVTTSDGQTRRFREGDVLRTEDLAPCKGHISDAGSTTVRTMIVR